MASKKATEERIEEVLAAVLAAEAEAVADGDACGMTWVARGPIAAGVCAARSFDNSRLEA